VPELVPARRLHGHELLSDRVDRLVAAIGQPPQRGELASVWLLARGVGEQLPLPGGKRHTLEQRLELSGGCEIHERTVPRFAPAQTGTCKAVPELGFALSSEDHTPNELVRQAVLAERAGFTFALISDHFHPWISAQGHSPFVWSTLGGIAQATESIRMGTGVTCPLIRQHPALVAHAAATVACMMPGRFFLGVGTGENLNEHVTGARWPLPFERLEMLEEAVDVIRALWSGEEITQRGRHYTVAQARLYDVPETQPDVYVAAAQPQAAELAGRIGDGLISTSPDDETVQTFESAGAKGKPKVGMMHVAYDQDAQAGLERAHRLWPNTGLKGSGGQELPAPRDFEAAADNVTVDDIAETTPHGPDPEPILEQIRKFGDAGFTHVYIHQIGYNQDEFAEFARRELMPRL
jgi:coenzyme F420-dependent glucose-6-phosphate dehydrogenase